MFVFYLCVKFKFNSDGVSFAFALLDLYSSGPNFDEMLLLETELPDELMQGGSSSWDQQMVSNKPPAQGPGPGQQQMYSNQLNGSDDAISSNVNLQRQQQQQQQHQLAHLLQQVKSKGPMNPHMGQISNKSPNLQGNNATVMNNLGVVSMPMSMAPNNNGTNNAMAMQGDSRRAFKLSQILILFSLLRHQHDGYECQSRNDNHQQRWKYQHTERGADVGRRLGDWE